MRHTPGAGCAIPQALVDRLHFLAHNQVITSLGASHRYRAVTQSRSPFAGGAVSQCIPSFETFLCLFQERAPCALFLRVWAKSPCAWCFHVLQWKVLLYEMCVKIKLSTGVCINYPQGCGQKSFRNFEEFLSCEIQENRLFKIFEKSLTNISACGCSSICSINLHMIQVFS